MSSVCRSGGGERYVFKLAESEAELEQIHRLNHRTFVRELRQHRDPGSGRLVDKFHHKNRYLIALSGKRVLGMVTVHDQPPFSIEDRLADPAAIARPGMRPLEVRLLAIDPRARGGKAFAGLLSMVEEFARRNRHTHLLISGLAEREGLYARLGFQRLGPPVESGSARFVPMIADLAQFPERIQRDLARWRRPAKARP